MKIAISKNLIQQLHLDTREHISAVIAHTLRILESRQKTAEQLQFKLHLTIQDIPCLLLLPAFPTLTFWLVAQSDLQDAGCAQYIRHEMILEAAQAAVEMLEIEEANNKDAHAPTLH